MILPDTDLGGALLVAEAMRANVEGLRITHRYAGPDSGVVTISAGVATVVPARGHSDSADLIRQADEALYQAKEGGRNRIAAASLRPVV